jgi:hypothetical protein
MPRGDKSSYTGKQKRKAEHIEEGYEKRGVNKETGGGNKSGSGRGVKDTNVSAKRGGRIGGKAAASRPAAARSQSAKKAAATRKRKAAARSSARKTARSGARKTARPGARKTARKR